MIEIAILTEDEIKPILTMKDTLEVVENAYREKGMGKVQMPPKTYILFKRFGGDFRVMPAYLEESNIAGVKIVSVFPENPRRADLPTVMATIVLLDPRNGAPFCIMDGTWITAMRTGGAGGVAVKYLARKDAKTIGVVGAGTQARTQLVALREVMPNIEEVRITDLFYEQSEKCAAEMRQIGIPASPCKELKDVVVDADIIITATPSKKPIIMNDWVAKGAHINAIGADAPGKQELDPYILKRAKIIVDDFEQAVHSGEVNVPISTGMLKRTEIHAEIGDIVTGKKKGRTSRDDITVFNATGLGILDIATSWLVYKKAKNAKKIKMS